MTLPEAGNALLRLQLEDIYGGMIRARATKQDASLLTLAASIARHGLLQPILVRRNAQAGRYALICGARRMLACRMLGMKEIDAIVMEADEATAAACFLEEHATRQDAHVLDEAELIERVGRARLAEACALDARDIERRTRLLALDERVRAFIRSRNLSAQQAAPLLALADVDRQMEAASIIAERSLTGAQARRLICAPQREADEGQSGRRRLLRAATEAAQQTARALERSGLAVRVQIQTQGQGVGVQILIRNARNGHTRQEKTGI